MSVITVYFRRMLSPAAVIEDDELPRRSRYRTCRPGVVFISRFCTVRTGKPQCQSAASLRFVLSPMPAIYHHHSPSTHGYATACAQYNDVAAATEYDYFGADLIECLDTSRGLLRGLRRLP